MNSRARYAIELGLLFVFYVVAAQVGFAMAPIYGVASPVWPASGLAVAAMILLGLRLAPAILLAALAVNVTAGISPFAAMGIAVGNTSEALLAGLILRHFTPFRPSLERLRDVAHLVVYGAFLSPALAATIGNLSLVGSGVVPATDMAQVWRVWWVGDALGVLVLTPLLLVYSARSRTLPSYVADPAVLLLAASILFLVFLGFWWGGSIDQFALTYLLFPLLIWAASAFGQRGATMAIAVGAVTAIALTASGQGPFVQPNVTQSLLDLQSFLAAIAMTALALGAIISERSVEEARLQKSEHILAESQRLTHIGSWCWDLASNRVSWSQELYRIFGVDPDSFQASYEGFQAHVHPDDRAHVERLIQQALHDHQPFAFTHRVRRPDGQVRIVACRGEVHTANGQGQVMVGTAQDITEQVAAETALKQANDQNEAIWTNLTEGLILTAPDHTIVRANDSACQILGLAWEQLAYRPCQEIFQQACLPNLAVNQLVTLERPSGPPIQLRLNVVSLDDGRRVITLRDVTREEELSRLKSDFISLASHELRTPISIMKGYLDLLIMADGLKLSQPERARVLQGMRRQGDRLTHLVADLLSAARIEQGTYPLHPHPFDPMALLRRLQQDFQVQADAVGSWLRLWLKSPPPPPVLADDHHVAQILSNLIDNALKYAPTNRVVDLKVEHTDRFVRMTVQDQGFGIAESDLPHLFSRFHRIATPAMYRQRGTGLGLYISRKLAELQGGILLVSSEPGQGSVFALVLPMASPTQEPPEREAPPQAA